MKHTYLLLLLSATWMLCACSPDRSAEPLFAQADSLLPHQPDSALHLLKTRLAPQALRRSDCARYALLLARATDKCELPLLPCDSLLDVALHHYGDNRKERAVALLYKGRLEQEMGQSERAINFFLEGLEIVKRFPQEIETRRHLLSSLGNEYLNARLYAKAKNTCQELLDYCLTDKDKAIALNSLANCYSMIGQEDSTFLLQHKALEYAQASGDSAILSTAALSLSVEYDVIEKTDTALQYARMSLQWLPEGKKRNKHYSNLGEILLNKGEQDSALYYIMKSIENNTNKEEKAYNLLNISHIKEEQGDYQAATMHLKQHIYIIDSLYCTEQSTQIVQLIHKHDIQMKINEEQKRGRNRLTILTSCFIICCFFIAFFFQNRINKRKRQQLINEQALKQAKDKLCSLQTTIEESQRIVTLLQKEHSTLIQEKEKNRQEIEEREAHIEKLKEEKLSLRNWLFKQSAIYNKVEKLSKQKVSDKKELRVLTDAEQKTLMETVQDIYAEYMDDMKTQYPKLTNEDLLYLCLNEIGFSPQTIALCFGNTDTHALAQRKYRLKQRMTEEK